MAGTKIKPQRIETNNSPQVGYVPKYVDEQTFEWGAGSGATDIGNNYLILTGTMAGTPPEVDITDTRITDTTPYLVFYETQPVGNITRTLTNGNLNIVSDDNADTLDVKVLFWNIGPARNYMKGNTTLTGAGPWTISDDRFTNTSPVMIMPRTTPVGYITAVSGAGTVTISSTGVETGVIVDYICTLDSTNYSDGMAYEPTLNDDDMFFRKGQSGDDEAVKWSDIKTKLSAGGFLGATDMINFSRDESAASGTVTYNHGLGVVPKLINITGKIASPGTYGYGSVGCHTNGKDYCFRDSNQNGYNGRDTSNCVVIMTNGVAGNTGIINNLTATTFDIVRTKVGLASSNDYRFTATLIG